MRQSEPYLISIRSSSFWDVYAVQTGIYLQTFRRKKSVPFSRVKQFKKNSGDQPTNQQIKELTDGSDLRECSSRHPSVCFAVLTLTAFMGSVTDISNYNRDCAYANEFPVAAEDLEVGKLESTAQEAEGRMTGP